MTKRGFIMPSKIAAVAFFMLIHTVALIAEENQSKEGPYNADLIRERQALVENAQIKRSKIVHQPCNDLNLEKKEGGCFSKKHNLVYGKSEYVSDPLKNDAWLDPVSAHFRCASSTEGGYYDWRLPTPKEVNQISNYLENVGLDPYLFYWTDLKWSTQEVVQKSKSLPDTIISTEQKRVHIGDSTSYSFRNSSSNSSTNSSSSTPVFDTEYRTSRHVNQSVHGEFAFDIHNMKLIRPSTLEQFRIKKVSGPKVTGMRQWDLQETVDSPGEIRFSTNDRSKEYVIEKFYEDPVYVSEGFGTSKPEVVNRHKQATIMESNLKGEIDPTEYFNVSKESVTKPQIGLFCVREPSK